MLLCKWQGPQCDTPLVALEEQLLFLYITILYSLIRSLPAAWSGYTCKSLNPSWQMFLHPKLWQFLTLEAVTGLDWTPGAKAGRQAGRQVHIIISSVLPSRSCWLTSSSSSSSPASTSFEGLQHSEGGLIECGESTENLLRALP